MLALLPAIAFALVEAVSVLANDVRAHDNTGGTALPGPVFCGAQQFGTDPVVARRFIHHESKHDGFLHDELRVDAHRYEANDFRIVLSHENGRFRVESMQPSGNELYSRRISELREQRGKALGIVWRAGPNLNYARMIAHRRELPPRLDELPRWRPRTEKENRSGLGRDRRGYKLPVAKTLNDLFYETLRDMYYAEKKILRTLPKLAKVVNSSDLSEAFLHHRDETEGQVERLEGVFELIGKSARGKTCDAIDGILEEGSGIIEDFKGTPALDAGLLAGAQAVEHYEISRYGTLITWAKELGLPEGANLLKTTLDQEINADKLLTKIAVKAVNLAARDK